MANKLSRSQEENLKVLQHFAGWFVFSQCIKELPVRINRLRFVLETLHQKGCLVRELNPNRKGIWDDDFYRYSLPNKASTRLGAGVACEDNLGDAPSG